MCPSHRTLITSPIVLLSVWLLIGTCLSVSCQLALFGHRLFVREAVRVAVEWKQVSQPEVDAFIEKCSHETTSKAGIVLHVLAPLIFTGTVYLGLASFGRESKTSRLTPFPYLAWMVAYELVKAILVVGAMWLTEDQKYMYNPIPWSALLPERLATRGLMALLTPLEGCFVLCFGALELKHHTIFASTGILLGFCAVSALRHVSMTLAWVLASV